MIGRGDSRIGGLSLDLATLAYEYAGLPIDPEFLRQDAQGQVESTRRFINLESGNVIANSYVAYFLLLALIDQRRLSIRVLLLVISGTLLFWIGGQSLFFSIPHQTPLIALP